MGIDLEHEFREVQILDISEDGNIFIEQSPDYVFVGFEDIEIDINKPFELTKESIKQGNNTIEFNNEKEFEELNNLIKERVKK